jgi:3-phenylpropionate/trans-cinnamate dioxygenase ferredoxin reductase component
MERVVVAGGGLAGVRAVESLRARGYRGRLALVSAERHPPYDRPPLSKDVLAGKVSDTTLDTDLNALGCEPLPGRRATGLRVDGTARGGTLETDAGPLDFDGLVIATGSTPVRLPGTGPQRTLRTIENARALREALVSGARVAIVGAGWIGAEVATAAARAGCRVTVVEAGEAPLAMAIGAEVGGRTARWYAAAGIDLRCGTKVAAVEDGGLALAGGGWIDADEVVTGIGVRPAVDWLAGSGIELADGVVTDARLRTNLPGVVAVGDCAAWWSGRYRRRLRVEHWDTALNAPDVAAATLLGAGGAAGADAAEGTGGEDGGVTYDPVPYFWSEQHGHMVQYAGHHPAGRELIWRGDPAGERWTACWVDGERLAAIVTVDRPRDLVQARRIMARGVSVDPDRLSDPAVAIRDSVRN